MGEEGEGEERRGRRGKLRKILRGFTTEDRMATRSLVQYHTGIQSNPCWSTTVVPVRLNARADVSTVLHNC